MEGKRVGASCVAASNTKLAGICICDCCLHRYRIYNISFTVMYKHSHTCIRYPASASVLGFAAFNSVATLSFNLINHGDRDSYLMHVSHTDSVAFADSMRLIQNMAWLMLSCVISPVVIACSFASCKYVVHQHCKRTSSIQMQQGHMQHFLPKNVNVCVVGLQNRTADSTGCCLPVSAQSDTPTLNAPA